MLKHFTWLSSACQKLAELFLASARLMKKDGSLQRVAVSAENWLCPGL